MIRVIIEHKVRDHNDVGKVVEVIRELRNEAMKLPGYLNGETLVNTDDETNVLVISNWRRLEDWEEWDNSITRLRITEPINALLAEPYTVRSFEQQRVRENRVWSSF